MDYSQYALSPKKLKRYEELKKEYLDLYDDPKNAIPKFLMPTKSSFTPVWEDRLADKDVMLKYHLEKHVPHIEIEDDAVLFARVDFGTCVVASAFGCDTFYPKNNLPCAKTHVVERREDIYNLKVPSLNEPIYEKVKNWTQYFLEKLPQGYNITMADVQGPFNNAHLVRGTGIFYDMYDDIDAFYHLMDVVTKATIEYAKAQRKWAKMEDDMQYDYTALWRGNGRISNCSLHMIGKDLYEKHVLKYDEEFLKEMKGGRIHYCGTAPGVIERMSMLKDNYGIDYDSNLHDIESIINSVDERVPLLQRTHIESKVIQKILKSKTWPFKKRNLIFSIAGDLSIDQAKDLYSKLRRVAEN